MSIPDPRTGAARLDAHPLDRAVWNALTGSQRAFALGDARAWRYAAQVAPFAALAEPSERCYEALGALVDSQGPAALFTPTWQEPACGLEALRRGVALQMVWRGDLDRPSRLQAQAQAQVLGPGDVPDMLALVAATQPGPFAERTLELGDYFGVRRDGKLLAMAGERMRFEGFTEVSAICVDEAARGQGLAAELLRLLVERIARRGDTAFLHVFAWNASAIALYRKLGFVERREMHLLVLGRAQSCAR